MKIGKSIFVVLCLTLFMMACNNPSDNLRNKFDSVNIGIAKRFFAADSLEKLHLVIESNKEMNPAIAEKADSVFNIISSSSKLIDSLKNILILHDSSGSSVGPSNKLLVNTKTGTLLIAALTSVVIECHSGLIDSQYLCTLNEELQDIEQLYDDKSMIKTYFEATPTTAAIAILTKFKNDCRAACITVLTDLKNHIRY